MKRDCWAPLLQRMCRDSCVGHLPHTSLRQLQLACDQSRCVGPIAATSEQPEGEQVASGLQTPVDHS